MKKIIYSAIFLFAVGVFTNAQQITLKNIKDNTLDYGKVKQNENGERIVQFKNTGDKPLIISNVQSTCGCTVPSWPKDPIMPGKKGEIKIVYNTKNVGSINKTITINSNDVKVPALAVHVTGMVEAVQTAAAATMPAPATH